MIEIKPAATVLIVKEHPEDGIQVLLLKRNSQLAFAPNFWVFPGGRIDPADGPFALDQLEYTAKIAAVREAREETNLRLNPEQLQHFCHWTTPSGGKKRFGTWFFHTEIQNGAGNVLIDQQEIVDSCWLHPKKALSLLAKKEIDLLPPTLITLNRIRNAFSYQEVQSEFKRTGVVRAAPVTRLHNGKFYCLYRGDSGYEKGDIGHDQRQHRLVIDAAARTYEFSYNNCSEFPPVTGGVPLLELE